MFIHTDSRCLFPVSQRPLLPPLSLAPPVSFNLSQLVGPRVPRVWLDLAAAWDLAWSMSIVQNVLSDGRIRISLAWLAVALTAASTLAGAEPTPSLWDADRSGWTDLMPSADLKGWSRVPVPPGGQLGRAQWHMEEAGKILVCDGDGGHDMLLCNQEFGDAVFHLECRYTKVEGKTGYNSGAYVRNSKDGAIWHQAQFGDAKDGYLFGETLLADGKKKFFNTNKTVTDGRVKPAGEWNTLEITARGKELTLWVNGAVTCQFPDCGNPRGLVGLEGEGYRIEFRNLKVKELR